MKSIADIARAAAASVRFPRTPEGELYARFGGDRYTSADVRLILLDRAAVGSGWRTINGVHVHIGDHGTIDKGPAALKGKTHAEAKEHVKSHGHDKADPHVKAEKTLKDHAAGKSADTTKRVLAKHTLGKDHPLVQKANGEAAKRMADLKPQYIGRETREAALNRYKAAKAVASASAKTPSESDLASETPMDAAGERELEASNPVESRKSAIRQRLDEISKAAPTFRGNLTRKRDYSDLNNAVAFTNKYKAEHDRLTGELAHIEKHGALLPAPAAQKPRMSREEIAAHNASRVKVGDEVRLWTGNTVTVKRVNPKSVTTEMGTTYKHHEYRLSAKPTTLSAATTLSRLQALACASVPQPLVTLSAVGDVLYLSAAVEAKDAITLGQGLPQAHNELPIHYRWMDAAVAGNWKHPKTGRPVPIDQKRIDKWVGGIKLSCSRGVTLPACKDHKETADNCVGAIYDAKRSGDRLALLIGFYGDDGLNVGRKNKLSIGIDPNFKDAYGNQYGEAIRHVAVTPVPVIPGQAGFLAA